MAPTVQPGMGAGIGGFAGSGLPPAGALPKRNGLEILAPGALYAGHTNGDWSMAWWRWAMALPPETSPGAAPSGAARDPQELDFSGPVWFLPGSPNAETERLQEKRPEAPRTWVCTVPEGKALFFPVAAFARYAPDDLDGARTLAQSLVKGADLPDEACLRIAVVWLGEHVKNLTCSIDGMPVQDLPTRWTESPAFEAVASDGLKSAGVTSGPKPLAVANGCWIMLAPPPLGRHTIHVSGSLVFHLAAGDPFDLEAVWDTTYEVNVSRVGAR
jgi:hypothetical protein